MAEFRGSIQDQIIQLMTHAITYPGFPSGAHRAFLVSNGYYDEEVHGAIAALNANVAYPSKVELISRGELLQDCIDLGEKLWPSELMQGRLLLEIYLADPKDILPSEKLGVLVGEILKLASGARAYKSKAEFERAATSAALLTGIATAQFAETENHWAVVSAWTLYATSLIASADRYRFNLKGVALASLQLAEETIIRSLLSLWRDVSDKPHLVEGSVIADAAIYRWRYTLIVGLLSSLLVYDDDTDLVDANTREDIERWLDRDHRHLLIWGEGAVPSLVTWLVWLRSFDPTIKADFRIAGLVSNVIMANQRDSGRALSGPYDRFDQIWRRGARIGDWRDESILSGETHEGSSYCSEALFHMLVRTKLKQMCRQLWPAFSHLAHRQVVPKAGWQYGTMHVSKGTEETRIYPAFYEWATMKDEAVGAPGGQTDIRMPVELTRRPWLLSLWWQLAPQRFTASAFRAFADSVLPGWGR